MRPKAIRKRCIICNELKHKREFSSIKEASGKICVECMKTCRIGQFKEKIREYDEEQKRKRINAYHRRYNYDPEFRERCKQSIQKFKERYPEKAEAWEAINFLPKPKGIQLHHWSYNKEHYIDVIAMRKQDHYKIHQYIKYDPESKMYRDKRSKFLLNTKSLHAAFISLILETY